MLTEFFVCFVIIGVAWKLLGKAVEKPASDSMDSTVFKNVYVPGVKF